MVCISHGGGEFREAIRQEMEEESQGKQYVQFDIVKNCDSIYTFFAVPSGSIDAPVETGLKSDPELSMHK
jgi:predicted NUDIX family phosphoesterase